MTKDRSTTEDDHLSYSRTALARIALSWELMELANQAAAKVPTTHDMWLRPGEAVSDALMLVSDAQEVLARAVVFERERGTSWEEIGARLDGITRQSAHARYKERIEDWQLGLVEPIAPGEHGRTGWQRLPEPAFRPTQALADLDKWAAERGEGEHAVSGHLPHLTTAAELVNLLDAIAHAAKGPRDNAAQVRLLLRKAALLDRIAAEDGDPEKAELAAAARAKAAELQAATDTETTGE
jgi:hypothetical protein